ncbi:MAG: hypothetical protein KAG56_05900 [Sulfurovaceae bacterium]|nr:hypothetical protein [Sulfurovaceae bacterium]
MRFILLSIPLILLSGCFNSHTPKEEKVIEETQQNINQTEQNIISKKSPSVQKKSTESIKTYTRDEILQRRGDDAICSTPFIPLRTSEPLIITSPTTPTTPIYPAYCNVYTKSDFVSEDVAPVENNIIEQSELKNYIDDYFQQLQTLNVDGIISMTYPKLFKPINEGLFRQYINTIVGSPQISVETFNTKIVYLGDVYPYENGEFAQIIYQSDITLNFLNPELYKDELSVRVLNNVLAGKYGQENIAIDGTQRTINIKKEEKLLAIKEQDEEWKFIGDNPSYRRLYPTILPSGILSQI